ncbi:hypothetical protein K440DRAFT_633446 [Wilcoxina mikolae CBS 423.85]|nr:hypothetical protein K440DRAFT_633446 [Wilcoxina mikolae CBS 423.85]
MPVLKALVESDCLQPCYIVECSDLDPRCVCQRLAAELVASKACAIRNCNKKGEENAFARLWAECLSRKAELGADSLASTMPPPTTAIATSITLRKTPSTTPPPTDSPSPTPTPIPDTTQAPEPDPVPVNASSKVPTKAPATRESDSVETEGKDEDNGNSSSVIAISIAIPTIFLVALALAICLFVRRRRRLQRISIDTFMDQSDANYPEIGGPLEIRHEKLPPFLNDLLQGPPTPPPSVARKTYQNRNFPEDPFKDQYYPMPEGRPGGTLSLFPPPVGRDRTPMQPPPIPQSPKPTFSSPRSRGKSVLSVISEVSLNEGSPNSQSELRMAYQELRREVNRVDTVIWTGNQGRGRNIGEEYEE